MAQAHSVALHTLAVLPTVPGRHPRLVAVSDVNRSLATDLAERFGYERVEDDWRSTVAADDVDLVVACLPPALNREVVLASAADATPPAGPPWPLTRREMQWLFEGLNPRYL